MNFVCLQSVYSSQKFSSVLYWPAQHTLPAMPLFPSVTSQRAEHTHYFFFLNEFIDVQSRCNQKKNPWICHYIANYHISLIKCLSCKSCCLDIILKKMLQWMKSMLMSSPFHSTVRLPSCWYDVPVTSHTPFLGATKRLSAAFPRHYIRSTVAMSWLEYFIRCQPAICRADEHTTIPTYSHNLSPCISLRGVTMHRLTRFSEGPRKASALF